MVVNSVSQLRVFSAVLMCCVLCLKALKEIQSEVARSKQLAEMEKDQIRMQAIYLKQLALLTGLYNNHQITT